MRALFVRSAGLFLFALLALPAAATIYQVGPGRAMTQLSQAAAVVNPGDIVEVDGNATYNAVTWSRSGSAAQPIIVRGKAFGAQRPVVNGGGGSNAFRIAADHYVVEDVVVTNASTFCLFMNGHNLTLRRVLVHTCAQQGILGADEGTGDMLLTEVEVYGVGNQAAPNGLHHPIYIATDRTLYPNAVLRIEYSWIHDNFSGNSIKSRASNLKAFYNWIETTNGQAHTIEAIGPDSGAGVAPCPVPNGTNDAQLCTGEIVGNVLIARSTGAFMMRLGSDSVGDSNGRYHVVNNTFIASSVFNSNSAAMIRAFGGIQSIELHNNIFWVAFDGLRIVRDVEANWINGRRVTGSNNLVTGNASTYASGIPGDQIQGLTNTIFVPTSAPIFAKPVNTAAPGTLDLRLLANSPARMAGNAGSTSTAGYQLPNPTNLPAMQPPRIRPDPGTFRATPRPIATNNAGKLVPTAISIGAYEFAKTASDLSVDGKSDPVFQNADGRITAWTMEGLTTTATANLIGAAAGWSVTHIDDLDGDGKGDIFFRHLDGRIYVYQMDGVRVVGGKELFGPATGWTISHTADLNGDGKADLILKHADGRAHLWLMDGTTIAGSASLLPAASGWSVVATGDLNGDGKADIVFSNVDGRGYIYLMNGTTIIGGAEFLSVGSGWVVSHAADFNNDGKADLVFRHVDGRAHLFLMNGTSFAGGASVLGPGTGWTVTHVGDFNGDGNADFVFQHVDGRAHVRLMNGTAILSAADVLPAASGFSITQLLDFNGDGKRDIVFRHTDGRIVVRLMNGLTTTASATLITAGGWSVVP
jgi:hypothetical protein